MDILCPKHKVPMIATIMDDTLCAVCEQWRANEMRDALAQIAEGARGDLRPSAAKIARDCLVRVGQLLSGLLSGLSRL